MECDINYYSIRLSLMRSKGLYLCIFGAIAIDSYLMVND